jgi:hypothetical protein
MITHQAPTMQKQAFVFLAKANTVQQNISIRFPGKTSIPALNGRRAGIQQRSRSKNELLPDFGFYIQRD